MRGQEIADDASQLDSSIESDTQGAERAHLLDLSRRIRTDASRLADHPGDRSTAAGVRDDLKSVVAEIGK